MKQLTAYFIIISICSLFSSLGCSSGVEGSFFPEYGLKEGDVIRIEITSTYKNTQWTGYKTAALETGTVMKLSLVGYDVEGNSNDTLSATWSSSDPNVATVDNTGNITAVSAGDAEITVKLMSTITGEVISDTIVLTILPAPVVGKKWVVADVSLPQSIWDHSSAIWNGYLYVAGGHSTCSADRNGNDCGFTDKVYYAPIKQDGSVGEFLQATVLPRYLRGHTLLSYNGYLYMIGGIVQPFYPEPPYPNPKNHKTILNEKVFYSKVNSDGSLRLWQETTPLPPPEDIPLEQRTSDKGGLFASSSTVHTISNGGTDSGYIYVTGGWNAELKKNLKTVLVGPINPDGSITNWIHNSQSDLPYNLSKHTSVSATVNGAKYIYVLGGNSGDLGSQAFHNEILYAKIESDGILSPWKFSSQKLPVQLIDHASASSGPFIFVLGGRDGDGGGGLDEETNYNIYSNVIYYHVDNTGDLLLLQRYEDLPVPLFHHAAVADINTSDNSINIYVTGGAGGNTAEQTNRKNTVYYLTTTQ